MAFVRAKQLRGKTYYALVENHREGGKVRQKVLASLGDSGDLLAALDRYQWLAKTCNTYAVYQVERFLRARETYYRKQYAEKLGAFWNRQAPKPEPVSVAALADADWQRKAEAEKSKPAEYLRIAEAIENFAKCGLTEEAWTAKRDKYLAQCEARRQEGTAYFQAIAKAFQASGMGRRRRKRSDIEMRATNLRDTTTAGYGATDTSSASDLPVPKCGAIRVQLSESCGTTADAQP